jgi:adenylyltransferase/sulfurtransferase
LNKENALKIVKDYTVVADCSDNMPTRYTVNEACLITHTPLAMGSAVGWAGQFTFYHINPKGPCYRCLYPNPSKNTINMSCNEKGIMGPVVGIIGNIQAIEIIKFCAFGESSFSDTMYNYDAFDGRFFNVTLRPKSPNCESCLAGLTQVNDYQMLCDRIAGQTPLSEVIQEEYRVTSNELLESLKNDQDAILIDVRPINEFKIAHHPRATNIPINEFSYEKGGLQTVMHLCKKNGDEEPPNKCFLICRRGNDSYRVLLLLKARFYGDKALDVVDVIGGYDSWRKDVDPNYPAY